MESCSTTSKRVFRFEVLYHKRSNNKTQKAKGLSRFDGILSVETPPSSLVTLEACNDYNDSSETCDSCSCSSIGDNNNDTEDEDDTKINKSKLNYKQFQKQFQKMRKQKIKKNKKTNSNYQKKENAALLANRNKDQCKTRIYSAVNANVAQSVLEKGGLLQEDDIIILPQWECQIVNVVDERVNHHEHDRVSLSMNNNANNIKTVSSFGNNKIHNRINHKNATATTGVQMCNTRSIGLNSKGLIGLKSKNIDNTNVDELHASNSSIGLCTKKCQFPLTSISLNKNLSTTKNKVPFSSRQINHALLLKRQNNDNNNQTTELSCDSKRLKVRHLSTLSATSSSTTSFFPGAIGSIHAPNSIKSILRPHQVEGIVFLWNCLTGASVALQHAWNKRQFNIKDNDDDGSTIRVKKSSTSYDYGAILADEMGLGKTLVTITVLYALHRRNRNDRFIVVCPSSLVGNWAKEFDKFIGKASQPKRVVIRKGGEHGLGLIKSFIPCKPQQTEVLIISYDLFRMHSDILSKSRNIGLLVVDEGHRLKNTSGSLTLSALQSLQCKARLVVTGTPIQNNLAEFYNIANFAIPGILGDLKSFRREFEKPISQAANKNSTQFQKDEGRRVSNELDSITSTFMIRRLQKDVLRSMLPPRSEFLLFCRPTSLQCNLYKSLTSNSNTTSDPLPLLTKLRKVCAHPLLLQQNNDVNRSCLVPDCSDSGKLHILDRLLESIKTRCPFDKVVVISNFTSALTLIEEAIIKRRGWPSLRLDGSVDQASRQSLVDSFNRGNTEQSFVFLLSCKAGGCGLNLCKANRLIMVDGDWNPANDLQAMARIYRQGQQKNTFIYRLFTSGTVEEVIYQRQTQKSNLASFSEEIKTQRKKGVQRTANQFTPEELRDCFTLKENCDCDTKNKIGLGWLNYDGVSSLQGQCCNDEPLLDVAAKEAKVLSFVHLVQINDVDDAYMFDQHPKVKEVFESDNNTVYNSSSEEEAEFE